MKNKTKLTPFQQGAINKAYELMKKRDKRIAEEDDFVYDFNAHWEYLREMMAGLVKLVLAGENPMESLNSILLTFLKTMLADLKRRSYDESGEQKEETLQRVEQLKTLINEMEKK